MRYGFTGLGKAWHRLRTKLSVGAGPILLVGCFEEGRGGGFGGVCEGVVVVVVVGFVFGVGVEGGAGKVSVGAEVEEEVAVFEDGSGGGEGNVEFFFFRWEGVKVIGCNVGLAAAGGLWGGNAERDGNGYFHDVVPDVEAGSTGKLERSLIHSFESLDDVKGLTFKNRHLASEHAFFEIGIEAEEGTELGLGLGPPFGGS